MGKSNKTNEHLLTDIRRLIDTAQKRAAHAFNAELTLLYWKIGSRLKAEVLDGARGEYAKQVVNT